MSRNKPAVDDGWDIGLIGLCALTLTALLFGGANRFDVMAPIVPRLIAIALLAWAFATSAFRFGSWSRLEKGFWILVFAVPLIQLIPLPFAWWSALPGHAYPRDLFTALTMAPAQPLSLAPDRTINSLLALLVPFAAYGLARGSDRDLFALIVRVIAVAALFNALLGLAQEAAGRGALRPYAITNPDHAVGLYANANHMASLLVVGVLALLVWLKDSGFSLRRREIPPLALALIGAILVVLAALWLSNSRAAMLILAMIAVLGAVATVAAFFGRSPGRVIAVLVGAGLAAGLLFILFAPHSTLTSLAAAMGTEDRARNLPIYFKMIADLFPFGSGMGSFDGIFKAYEPVANLSPSYLNHAHNDYAQVLIEAGLAAAVGLILFGIWWARGALAYVRDKSAPGDPAHLLDLFALAGTGVFLIHSFGEYPLRASANALIFAILCARIAQSRARAIPV